MSPSVGFAPLLLFSFFGLDVLWYFGIIAFFIVAILIKRGELTQIRDVLDRAWVGILVGIVIIFLSATFTFCPVSATCPPNTCVWWDVFCHLNWQSSNSACQTQGGLAITVCHLGMIAVQMMGYLIILASGLRIAWNILHKQERIRDAIKD